MDRFTPNFIKLQAVLKKAGDVAANFDNNFSAYHHHQLTFLTQQADDLLQQLAETRAPSSLTEIDILRIQYLDLSKELYEMKVSAAPLEQQEAAGNVLNLLLQKIKLIENVDPSSLMLD